jgi:hypothetical protein
MGKQEVDIGIENEAGNGKVTTQLSREERRKKRRISISSISS